VSQDNIETSRRLIEEAFNSGNLDVLDEVYADGFVDHDPLLGDRDVEGVRGSIATYRDAFPDLTITIEDVIAAGDKVVVRWSAEGTFENEFMGHEPTGEKGDPVNGIGIDHFDDDGKIVEAWSQWDMLTLFRNVGAMPEATAGS
jgi:steroid delta-isomerase-like uncharacterized protein